jgi:predicted nucleic acid-binding protein
MSVVSKSSFVFDTNQVIGAGTRWLVNPEFAQPNEKARLICHVAKNHRGVYSREIVGEYLVKLHQLGHTTERSAKLLAIITGSFECIKLRTKSCSHPPSDPDDEVFILCALDGPADYLVTEDRALLDVKDHYPAIHIGSIQSLGLDAQLTP